MRTTSRAFTLVELLVAVTITALLVGITSGAYSLIRRSIAQDQAKADIVQNARIALDRLTRELRQTPDVVTTLPVDQNDVSVAQPGYIEFEDGHANDLTYRKYYIVGVTLKVDVKQYYFSYDTGTRVKWNAVGTHGESPVSSVISTNDIADGVQSIKFYGTNVVQIVITTTDSVNQTFQLRTSVLGRNL